jgi:hypothetical protein
MLGYRFQNLLRSKRCQPVPFLCVILGPVDSLILRPCPFGQIAEKLRPISVIPENLFPSISTRPGVMDRIGKLNMRRP